MITSRNLRLLSMTLTTARSDGQGSRTAWALDRLRWMEPWVVDMKSPNQAQWGRVAYPLIRRIVLTSLWKYCLSNRICSIKAQVCWTGRILTLQSAVEKPAPTDWISVVTVTLTTTALWLVLSVKAAVIVMNIRLIGNTESTPRIKFPAMHLRLFISIGSTLATRTPN